MRAERHPPWLRPGRVPRLTIIVDEPGKGPHTVPACVTGVAWLNGKSMRTIEGAARVDEQGQTTASAVQKAFLEHFRSSAAIARRAL